MAARIRSIQVEEGMISSYDERCVIILEHLNSNNNANICRSWIDDTIKNGVVNEYIELRYYEDYDSPVNSFLGYRRSSRRLIVPLRIYQFETVDEALAFRLAMGDLIFNERPGLKRTNSKWVGS